MRGRTIILISHHVQLCAQGAAYVVALDNGRVRFKGNQKAFYASDILAGSQQSGPSNAPSEGVYSRLPAVPSFVDNKLPFSDSDVIGPAIEEQKPKVVRNLIEEEERSVGTIATSVWSAYLEACGKHWYWISFTLVFVLANLIPVGEKGWVSWVLSSLIEIQRLTSL